MNDVRSAIPGTAARTFSSVFRKMSAPAPRFIRFSTSGDACCSGTSRYLQMLSWLGDRLQQSICDPVRIRIQESQPPQAFDLCQRIQQRCQPVLQSQILAVAGRVLPNQRNLLHAACHQPLRLRHHRLEPPRTKLPAQVGNDAESCTDDRTPRQS